MKYFCLFILILAYFTSACQVNYHKAAVVNSNGVTLQGYINYREWDENPKFIEFKKNITDKTPQVFYPSTVRSFVIDSMDEYHSCNCRISLNKTRFPDIETSKDTSAKVGAIFLKLTATGSKVSMYSYTDSIKTRFYIQEATGQPMELFYQLYYDDTKTQAISIKTYIGQLSYLTTKYLPGNNKLINFIEKLNYDYGDIEQVVNAINGVNKVNNKKKKRSAQWARFFGGAALNITQTGAYGDGNYLSRAPKSTTTGPKFNLGVDIFNNPYVQKFALRFELSFSYINPSLVSNLPSALGYSAETFQFNQYNIALTPQLIYNAYNKDDIKVYVSGGIGFVYSKYTNAQAFTLTAYTNYPNAVYYELQNSWVRFNLQTGLVLKKRWELFLSYSPLAAYTHYDNFAIESSSYNFGVHWLFSKTSKK